MWNKAKERFRTRSLIATIALVFSVIVSSVIMVLYIWNYVTEQCFDDLKRATTETITGVEGQFSADRSQLRFISRLLAMNDEDINNNSVRKAITTYKVHSVYSDMGFLTPQDIVIKLDGEKLDASHVLNYEEIHMRGEHVSTLEEDLVVPGQYNLRNYVPVKKDGKTTGFLYTTFVPEDIINSWLPNIYDGNATVTIIDRENGRVILDEAGREMENVGDWDLDLKTFTVANHTFESAILNAQKGFAIAKDKATGEDMYYCFYPMRMEKWELLVMVPRHEMFKSVAGMNRGLVVFLSFEAISLICYFGYILHITIGSVIGIERRASIDGLTGLQNRNRYEYFCQKWAQGVDGMACIYIDVNGLHEVNNTQGHLVGDVMLKYISGAIKEEFGENNTYRIGGDEFVAFRYEQDEDSVRNDIRKVMEIIEAAGYHVAIGMAMATPDRKLITVIKEAESEMYENKNMYYKSIGKQMR